MEDEKFDFYQDISEKKKAARSSHNRRSHCGKRGAVKFNSDYLSNKELKAMSGEVKAYRLNDPMSWKEFKALPDDIKKTYIKGIQNRFNAPAFKIAEMMGVSGGSISNIAKQLGLVFKPGQRDFKAEDWQRWICHEEATKATEKQPEVVTVPYIPYIEPTEAEYCETAAPAVPCSGCLTFTGAADDALKTVARILGNAEFKIKVIWGEV